MSMIDSAFDQALGRFLDLTVFRQGLITSNLANIDTPGYRTRDVNFSQELDRADRGDGDLQFAVFAPVVRQVRGLAERPDGNNVSLERETLLLAESQLRFNLGIQLLRDDFHSLSAAIHEGSTSS